VGCDAGDVVLAVLVGLVVLGGATVQLSTWAGDDTGPRAP